MKHQNYYYNYNFATKQEGLSSLDFEECLKQCTLVAGNIMALDQFNAIVPVDESQCVDIPTATATAMAMALSEYLPILLSYWETLP